MNPIFAREWRARWRDKRSFWLLFALCALMALLVGVVYSDAVNKFDNYNSIPAYYREATNQSSAAGRQLFQAIAYANAFAWLFIAPALSATPLARERERGLLESLQLSQMKPRQQILARFRSHLAFLIALQTITLPVYGICIAFGGVSSDEIVGEMICVLLIAMLGTAFGMWVSSRSYRPMGALFTTLGGVIFWVAGLPAMLTGRVVLGNYDLEVWRFFHPIFSLQALLERTFYAGSPGSFMSDLPYLLGINGVLITALLLDCARMSNKNFPPASWRARNTLVAKWKAKIEVNRLERERQKLAHYTRERVAGALVADLPLEKFVHFENPVLAREVKARFRLRKAGILVSLARYAAFFSGTGLWLSTGYNLLDPIVTDTTMLWLLLSLCLGGSGFVALMASSSFAREVESGTWEGLRLSLLTNYEILSAKFASPIIAFWYYTLPLWLLMPFLLKVIYPIELLLSFLVLGSSLALSSAVGLWCSRKNQAPVTAACWTFGVLVCLWGAGPMLLDSLHLNRYLVFISDYDPIYNSGYYSPRTLFFNYSPPIILSELSELKRTAASGGYTWGEDTKLVIRHTYQTAWISSIISLFITLILLWKLFRDLEEGPDRSLSAIERLSRGLRFLGRS